MKFEAAIIQFTPFQGDIDANTGLIGDYLREVAGARLVVLPELASTGYDFAGRKAAWSLSEEPGSSRYIAMLLSVAAKNKQYIVSGFNERSGDKIYNAAVLLGPDGIEGIYRKLHLFMNEKELFTPGTGGLCVYDIGFCRLGLQICFDYLFPEPWRILAMKGAELICHPSNLLTQNAARVLPGIALMNRISILTANRTGHEGNLVFNGGSMITGPAGDVQVKAAEKDPAIVRHVIDPALSHDKMITPMNHVFNDRRPEQYLPDNC
jgi:predicted amidohydrolase